MTPKDWQAARQMSAEIREQLRLMGELDGDKFCDDVEAVRLGNRILQIELALTRFFLALNENILARSTMPSMSEGAVDE